jgi:hypothetical protein
MKRIINGKRYDTSIAEAVASHTKSDRGSFSWLSETLYRTKGGCYFLSGEGHAQTRWADHHDDGSRGPGEGILPMLDIEAREWLEGHEQTEALEHYFGGSITDA